MLTAERLTAEKHRHSDASAPAKKRITRHVRSIERQLGDVDRKIECMSQNRQTGRAR
jgi:hypothetical protein